MADKRAFAKFDVGYLDNPKVEPILDANPNAVLMHIASVLYCAQHLTDGEITMRAMQRRVGGSSDDARALLGAGLWHEVGHDCPSCPQPSEGKVFVHDYLEHNRTSEGVKRKSIAGRKGAQVRWEGDADGMQAASESHANRNAETPEPQWLEREKEKKIRPILTNPTTSGQTCRRSLITWWRHSKPTTSARAKSESPGTRQPAS